MLYQSPTACCMSNYAKPAIDALCQSIDVFMMLILYPQFGDEDTNG